mmetsp:Transcript_7584/g.32074  ORF Transcript_7584/g.32074 Transcript_7584/m.32074 type:complete len:225 (-) Transcript_7584:1403-2077(-)
MWAAPVGRRKSLAPSRSQSANTAGPMGMAGSALVNSTAPVLALMTAIALAPTASKWCEGVPSWRGMIASEGWLPLRTKLRPCCLPLFAGLRQFSAVSVVHSWSPVSERHTTRPFDIRYTRFAVKRSLATTTGGSMWTSPCRSMTSLPSFSLLRRLERLSSSQRVCSKMTSVEGTPVLARAMHFFLPSGLWSEGITSRRSTSSSPLMSAKVLPEGRERPVRGLPV